MANVSDEDIQKTSALLAKFDPGFLPYPVFVQVARLVALPIIEFIPLRRGENGQTQVLLIERPADDPLWPGLWHTPGTVVRATDTHRGQEGGWQAFERIRHDELKDTAVGTPHFVGSLFHTSKRGAEQAQLYWVEVTAQPAVGEFYDAGDLPQNMISSQRDFIGQAVKSFEAEQPPKAVKPRRDQIS